MAQPIILYDIPSMMPGKAFSSNTLKVRYCLGYKGLVFKTVWIEAPDIEERMKAIGAKPTRVKSDGSDFYTLPVIEDPSTGAIVSDSLVIVEYLDKTYTSTPAVLPPDTRAFMHVLDSAIISTITPTFKMMASKCKPKLYPRNQDYYVKVYKVICRVENWDDLWPVGPNREEDWRKFKVALATIDGWYTKSDGKWMMGDTFSYADIIIAAWIRCTSLILDESEWEEASLWNNGRWRNLLTDFDKYLILD